MACRDAAAKGQASWRVGGTAREMLNRFSFKPFLAERRVRLGNSFALTTPRKRGQTDARTATTGGTNTSVGFTRRRLMRLKSSVTISCTTSS